MKIRNIKIPDGKEGHYTIFESPDFEYVNPVEYYSESFKQSSITIMRDLLLAKEIPTKNIDSIIIKKAEKQWKESYDKFITTDVPPNFIKLLNSKTKQEQIKLLRGQGITSDQLVSFIIKAFIDFGYSFSQYRAEYAQKGLDKTAIPKIIEIKSDKVIKVGTTLLTNGQLKQAVQHRKVTISKFLDNGKIWHCFFMTYKSLRHEESWKGGQPHFHYISDKFGHDRVKVVRMLKSEKYSLGNLPHIDFFRFNNDSE
jgi:uncharacterized membrane protein